jgi:rapamycin-insensitive companion of mTOR
VPPHFYRELTRTEEGCRLLKEKGHFDEFASTIREHGMQSDDLEMITKVKGCLWAVGNVGSIDFGGPFLESCDVVSDIIRIAQSHDVMSLRGTAFFVLGLISRSWHGLEILSEHGWDAHALENGNSLGLCIPTDLSKLFSFQPWRNETIASIHLPDTQKTAPNPPPPTPARPPLEKEDLPDESDETLNSRILDLAVDLGNMVLFNRAMTELLQIKARKASGFRSPKLFKQVMALMEYNHYSLPIRNRIFKLFDKRVLRQIVFEEDADEEGGGGVRDGEGDDDDSSSGDENRTERQRSISDPSQLEDADKRDMQYQRNEI